MRIPHLEDLLFEDGDINAVLNGIKDRIYPITVKWDGSPAFVVGQGFVAFKTGYELKNPLVFRSSKEIETIGSLNLRGKMQLLFDKLSDSENILFGDFMFDSDMLETEIIQPNTVKYVMDIDHTQYDLGVAIHKGEFEPCDRVYYAPLSPMIDYSIDYIPCVTQRSLRSTDKSRLAKYVNAKIREDSFFELDSDEIEIEQDILDDYMNLSHWKNTILSIMEIETDLKPIDGHVHEGLVLDVDGRLVKLVDRTVFSRMNFERHRNGRESV